MSDLGPTTQQTRQPGRRQHFVSPLMRMTCTKGCRASALEYEGKRETATRSTRRGREEQVQEDRAHIVLVDVLDELGRRHLRTLAEVVHVLLVDCDDVKRRLSRWRRRERG